MTLAIDASQFVPRFSSKLRIRKKYVDGIGNLIGNGMAWSMAARPKFKIVDVIVHFTDFVMHSLFWSKFPPKMLFHDVTVEKHLSARLTWLSGDPHHNVSTSDSRGEISSIELLNELGSLPVRLALNVAKLLLGIVFQSPAGLICLHRVVLAALNTYKKFSRRIVGFPTNCRAFERTVKGFPAPSLYVFAKFGLPSDKLASTRLARECGRRELRVLPVVLVVAALRAKLSVASSLQPIKWFPAILARFHGGYSVRYSHIYPYHHGYKAAIGVL